MNAVLTFLAYVAGLAALSGHLTAAHVARPAAGQRQRGAVRVELLVFGLVAALGTLVLVLTHNAQAESFDKIVWGLVAIGGGGSIGSATGRKRGGS